MIINNETLPPPIIQKFNRNLLDPWLAILTNVEEKIIPLAQRKIRTQDIGKQRDFERLKKEFFEVYERKKAEKAEYEAEIKKKVKERPCIPNAGKTMRFKRKADPKLLL